MAKLWASQTRHSRLGPFKVLPAPQPEEIYWPNMYMHTYVAKTRGIIVWAATIALVILWIIPLTFVSSLVSLDNLMMILPFLRPVMEMSPILSGFLTGFLPSLAIIIFFAVLPLIMERMFLYLVTFPQLN